MFFIIGYILRIQTSEGFPSWLITTWIIYRFISYLYHPLLSLGNIKTLDTVCKKLAEKNNKTPKIKMIIRNFHIESKMDHYRIDGRNKTQSTDCKVYTFEA